MKKIICFVLLTSFLFSCKKETQKNSVPKNSVSIGKEIFEGKGNCIACHQENKKTIGPSLEEIANIYKTKNGSIVNFLQQKSDPIVDLEQYPVMKANLNITKEMSQDELQALENYIYSLNKK